MSFALNSSLKTKTDRGAFGEPHSSTVDVAIIGAGPYGMAAASHLRGLSDLEVRVFGEPMTFWRGMPRGMLLRSAWDACHIGFPEGNLTLDSYKAEARADFGKPVPLDAFIDYGCWFQRRAVPDLDSRRVTMVESAPGGFRVSTEDGDTTRAKRVVVAAGIEAFPARPPVFDTLPRDLVSHSLDHDDLSRFAGRRIVVVGGGQSALESAALLHESGAEVEVIARKENIIWLHGGTVQRRLGRFKPLFYAQTDVGPAGLSRLVAVPELFCRLPRPAQEKLAYRAIRPAGARWLVDRLASVPITTARNVEHASPAHNRVRLVLDDGSQRSADHVILGTGYRIDVARYDFLAPQVARRIDCVGGYPVLRKGLESSVPGLHFLGAPAAYSFGPIMRFVSGSWYAAENLANALQKSARVR
jgi:cation diffusion facilitator CzcD-associated flavoprotein CzcO